MIELTEEQRQLVEETETPRLVDPVSGQEYVLIRADHYAKIASLLGTDFEPREAYAAIDRAFGPGWNDPKMDDYDRYEELSP